VVLKTNDPYLTGVLSRLGRKTLLDLAGLKSSESPGSKAYVRPLSQPGVHPVGVIHMTDGMATASLFAKAQKADYHGGQSLENESNFLSNVAPLIAAENPALRSPLPVAYYPDRGLLLMEFVPGNSLKHHLFDLTFNRHGAPNLGELLQHAGRWLGSLHRLTLNAAYGNPLDWLVHEFDKERTREAFILYSLKDSYVEMLSILKRCQTLNPRFQRNLCNVHGEFTPIHIMVANEAIYVVDFGNSRLGYLYEDIGLFEAFYDSLLPWRAFVGSYRIKLQVQKQLFLRGYLEQSPAPFSGADKAIMRWVRLISFARMLNGGQRRYDGWQKWAYSSLALRALRDRFTQACCDELIALRRLPMDTFDAEVDSSAGSDCASCRPLNVAGMTGD
jgi:tRNA A-37 threonylcarbamoyl transferase component Bud32